MWFTFNSTIKSMWAKSVAYFNQEGLDRSNLASFISEFVDVIETTRNSEKTQLKNVK